MPGTLSAFTRQAQQGSDLLMSSYADSRDPETVATVREFAATALRRIEAMDATAPPEAQGDLRAAALALRDIDARASELCDTCADLPALAVPKVFLASAEVDRAMRRFAAAQPDNSHPVVAAKQDVRRAASAARWRPGRDHLEAALDRHVPRRHRHRTPPLRPPYRPCRRPRPPPAPDPSCRS